MKKLKLNYDEVKKYLLKEYSKGLKQGGVSGTRGQLNRKILGRQVAKHQLSTEEQIYLSAARPNSQGGASVFASFQPSRKRINAGAIRRDEPFLHPGVAGKDMLIFEQRKRS